VFVQQFLCLPCHPMISCMIDESSDTLRIPLKFAQKLADKMEDFDRTGLKVGSSPCDGFGSSDVPAISRLPCRIGARPPAGSPALFHWTL
jgi:hypothetical protein